MFVKFLQALAYNKQVIDKKFKLNNIFIAKASKKQLRMDTIYLPIRAFGDFTISAAVIKKSGAEKIPILLPKYLIELFNVLEGENIFNVVDIIQLDKYHKLFQLRKVKSIKDFRELLYEVKTIKKSLDKKNSYLLDYKSKRARILSDKLYYPILDGNIYNSKAAFFAKHFNINAGLSHVPEKKIPIENIVLFPGSRLASKALSDELVASIISALKQQGFNVSTMYHESEKTLLKDVDYFRNFTALKKLVVSADLIISADSLPLHIANFFDKFHFVIYNGKENYQWETPSTRYYNSSAVYTNNKNEVIKKILLFISIVRNAVLQGITV